MDKKRATEIAKSQEMLHVNYNGNPIYIEDINPTKDAASIHFLNKPDQSQEVSLNQLEEFK
ncbi:MAG: H-type small acid-soluble spore protein [Mobilitalea sp.]